MAHMALLFPEGEEVLADSGTQSFSWERGEPSDGGWEGQGLFTVEIPGGLHCTVQCGQNTDNHERQPQQ